MSQSCQDARAAFVSPGPDKSQGTGSSASYFANDGNNAASTPTPAMHASPPETTDSWVPKTAATDPASTSPIRGPPVTTTMNTPCNRPRNASGVATCRIVLRKIALTMSAAPAMPSRSNASHSTLVNPNSAMEPPQMTTETRTAKPCRRTRPAQPDVTAPTSAPSDGAAASKPTVPAPPWNHVTPIAGNR